MSSPCSLIPRFRQSNLTCKDYRLGDSLIGAFMLLMAIVSVVSNTVVLLLLIMYRKLHTASFCLICNLAVADLIVGLFNMPLYATDLLLGQWTRWDALCDFIIFIDYVPVLASLLTTIAIAITRYETLSPKSSRSALRKCQKNAIWVLFTWSASIGMWVANLYQERPVQLFGQSRCMASPSSNKPYAIAATVTVHHLPSLMVIYFNSVIIVHVRFLISQRLSVGTAQMSEISSQVTDSDASTSVVHRVSMVVRQSLGLNSNELPEIMWLAPITVMLKSSPADGETSTREIRVIQVLGSIMAMHVALWLPSFIMYDVDIARDAGGSYNILRFLSYTNSATNPFLYSFSSEDFQRVYWEAAGVKVDDARVNGVAKLTHKKKGKRKAEKKPDVDDDIKNNKRGKKHFPEAGSPGKFPGVSNAHIQLSPSM